MTYAVRLGRAPWTTAGELDDAQRRLRDQIRHKWGNGALGLSPVDQDGRLLGPFDLMTASPEVGGALLEAAASFRTAALSPLERELVILVVAAAEGATFMWEGHLPVGLAAGLDVKAAEAIGRGETPTFAEPLDMLHRVARHLTEDGDLDDTTFEAALARFGWRRLQETVWLVGLYKALGLAMRVARTPLPAGEGR